MPPPERLFARPALAAALVVVAAGLAGAAARRAYLASRVAAVSRAARALQARGVASLDREFACGCLQSPDPDAPSCCPVHHLCPGTMRVLAGEAPRQGRLVATTKSGGVCSLGPADIGLDTPGLTLSYEGTLDDVAYRRDVAHGFTVRAELATCGRVIRAAAGATALTGRHHAASTEVTVEIE